MLLVTYPTLSHMISGHSGRSPDTEFAESGFYANRIREGGLGANFVSVKPEDSASTSLHLIFSCTPIPVIQDGRLLPDRRQEGRLPRRK